MLLDLLEDLNDLVTEDGVAALNEDLLEFGLDEDDEELLEDEVLLSLLIEHAESLGEEELLEGIFSALKKAAGRVKKAAGRVAGDYRAAKKAVDQRVGKRGAAKKRLGRMKTKQFHKKEKKKAYGRAWQAKGARSSRRRDQLRQNAPKQKVKNSANRSQSNARGRQTSPSVAKRTGRAANRLRAKNTGSRGRVRARPRLRGRSSMNTGRRVGAR